MCCQLTGRGVCPNCARGVVMWHPECRSWHLRFKTRSFSHRSPPNAIFHSDSHLVEESSP